MSSSSTLLVSGNKHIPQAVQNPNFTYSAMEAYDHDHYYHHHNHYQVPEKSEKGLKRSIKSMDVGLRIAFRTKSEVEIMDDGFKWRKYGKKWVKDSPNPRNYYKCSNQGCNVKKRVERDREDSSYVITTYEGVHNHESPCVVLQ